MAFNAELCGPGIERNVQCLRTMRLYPLEGISFASKQDEQRALWLLNWMHWAHRGRTVDTSFRPPLVVIEGPPMCGKTTLLKRLAEIAEVPLTYTFEVDPPRRGKWQTPVLVYDNIDDTEVALNQFELLGMLEAETWKGRMLRHSDRQTMMLGFLMVMTGCGIELPPELHRRAMFIRLKEHAE